MKNLKNLGEILNKEEQQSINGGGLSLTGQKGVCGLDYTCRPGYCCSGYYPNYPCKKIVGNGGALGDPGCR